MSDASPELTSSPSASNLGREFEALARRAEQPGSDIAMLTLPVEPVPPAALVQLGKVSFSWQPDDGTAWVGIDCARRYRASGSARFSAIREAVGRDLGEDPRLRVFGGFAFGEGTAEGWEDFGEALFVLPRFSYQESDAGATLGLALTREDFARREVAMGWLEELLRLAAGLAERRVPVGLSEPPRATRDLSHDAFAELVEDILGRIDRGQATKIVAARRTQLEFERPVNLAATLSALRQNAGGSTCFALRLGERTFLGASPERLIRKQGLNIETEALAGTFRTTGSPLAAELLRSPKEHLEHLPVLEAIVRALTPWCHTLEHPKQPAMRELPDLLHLRTPIQGLLRGPRHVLELVERLHPTPAVGGVPTDVALSWIREREGAQRGWYAGPLGWFDGRGDGDFLVALRSGLVANRHVTLYAGGGIVRGSDAVGEYAETELKLRALGQALRFG